MEVEVDALGLKVLMSVVVIVRVEVMMDGAGVMVLTIEVVLSTVSVTCLPVTTWKTVDFGSPVSVFVTKDAVPSAIATPMAPLFVEVTDGPVTATVVEVVESVVVVSVTALGSIVVADSIVDVLSATVVVVYDVVSSVTTTTLVHVAGVDAGVGGPGPVRL